MIVILDTNIICRNYMMTSGPFDVLFDFVDKTKSSIRLPRIVFEELLANHGRDLESRLEVHASAVERVNACQHGPDLPLADIDLDEASRQYESYSLARLRVKKSELVDYPDSYLREAVTRAINRVRPCTDRGGEIRDAVIWLTVKEIARGAAGDEVALVSANWKQFATKDDRLHLHPDLAAELKDEGLHIDYFVGLEEFTRKHAVPVKFITRDWLLENLDTETILKEALALVKAEGHSRLRGRHDGDVEIVVPGSLAEASFGIEKHYVYTMADGSHRVEALLDTEIDLDCWVTPPAVSREWRLHGRDAWRELITTTSGEDFDCPAAPEQFNVTFALGITVEVVVEDEKVKDWELVDCHVTMPLGLLRLASN